MKLRRKCGGNGCCTDCDKKKLQRVAEGPSPMQVPAIVHDVLRRSGEPLDGATRASMEPRFAHDFSRVRVHRDARAAESAAAVGARAYTVGSNVVLGRGATQDVLAHELAHTIQQEGASASGALEIGRADDPLEQEADAMAAGGKGRAVSQRVSRAVLRRKTDDAAQVAQHANTPMSPDAVKNATAAVGAAKVTADQATLDREALLKPGTVQSTFILHDTAAAVSADGIKTQVRENRGPLGRGVTAYAPRDAAPTITRPFFETFRPTTTEFEKALDVFATDEEKKKNEFKPDVLKARRDAAFRKVWQLTNPAIRRTLVEAAITGMELTPAELKIELEGKDKKTKEGTKHEPGALEQLNDPTAKATIYTTATWTIQLISFFAQWGLFGFAVAAKGKLNELRAAAAAVDPYFRARNAITGTTNTVEIVQPGASAAGQKVDHKNTCSPNNPLNQKFASPSYSDTQYNGVRDLYLRAAVRTNIFPYITTHRAVDAKYGGHCDPRCFNLGRLYDDIATTVGHTKGTSRYGIEPSYGTSAGTSIWWDEGAHSVCAEAKPK
jgi:hypothetical protein